MYQVISSYPANYEITFRPNYWIYIHILHSNILIYKTNNERGHKHGNISMKY